MTFIDTDSELPHNNVGIVFKDKKDAVRDELIPYTKAIHADICINDSSNKSIVIGYMNGHFFNLSLFCLHKRSKQIIVLLRAYNEETFDICRNLCKETNCFKGNGQNIFHLDRFYIKPEYRGMGIGTSAYIEFYNMLPLYLHQKIRYIGLFPDPITNDLNFDSMYDMPKSKRDLTIQKLKQFYSSLGFKEMKIKTEYMYTDCYNTSYNRPFADWDSVNTH